MPAPVWTQRKHLLSLVKPGFGGATSSVPQVPAEFKSLIEGSTGKMVEQQNLNPISQYNQAPAMGTEGMTPGQQQGMSSTMGAMQQTPSNFLAMQAAQRAAGMAGAGPTTGQYDSSNEMGLQDWARLMNPYFGTGGEMGVQQGDSTLPGGRPTDPSSGGGGAPGVPQVPPVLPPGGPNPPDPRVVPPRATEPSQGGNGMHLQSGLQMPSSTPMQPAINTSGGYIPPPPQTGPQLHGGPDTTPWVDPTSYTGPRQQIGAMQGGHLSVDPVGGGLIWNEDPGAANNPLMGASGQGGGYSGGALSNYESARNPGGAGWDPTKIGSGLLFETDENGFPIGPGGIHYTGAQHEWGGNTALAHAFAASGLTPEDYARWLAQGNQARTNFGKSPTAAANLAAGSDIFGNGLPAGHQAGGAQSSMTGAWRPQDHIVAGTTPNQPQSGPQQASTAPSSAAARNAAATANARRTPTPAARARG